VDDPLYCLATFFMESLKLTHIYLIIDHHTGMIKIGRSLNPRLREQTLLSVAPLLELIFLSPLCDASLESFFHEVFANMRGRGEWFGLGREEITYIRHFNYSDYSSSPITV